MAGEQGEIPLKPPCPEYHQWALVAVEVIGNPMNTVHSAKELVSDVVNGLEVSTKDKALRINGGTVVKIIPSNIPEFDIVIHKLEAELASIELKSIEGAAQAGNATGIIAVAMRKSEECKKSIEFVKAARAKYIGV